MSGPASVWRLVEAIPCGYGTDPDRFEKNVVSGVSTHADQISVVAL